MKNIRYKIPREFLGYENPVDIYSYNKNYPSLRIVGIVNITSFIYRKILYGKS